MTSRTARTARALTVAAQVASSDLNPTYAEPIVQRIASIVASGQPLTALADVAEHLDALIDGVGQPGSADNEPLEKDLARWVRELRELAQPNSPRREVLTRQHQPRNAA